MIALLPSHPPRVTNQLISCVCFFVESVLTFCADVVSRFSQEEQANLLGELGVLRNHKHPHLVEFIGTAMAMERGADTVREIFILGV